MTLTFVSRSMCEELCRKRVLLEKSILGKNTIDMSKCIKICIEAAKD